uniref:Uncharacterized protein n=1 Tax=Erpetoichthys calabaricus TaxID=27687 RepID=A0A8C4SJX7_ERPCA
MEQKSLQEELTCAICLNIYKDPVVIPCQHSFCYECIKEYWIQKPYNISCDSTRSCLKCETSFCSLHLQAHLTRQNLKEHMLCRPVANFSERKCSVHSKVFEFYCKEDGCCVCASCSVHGTHRNHTLLSLEEAALTRYRSRILLTYSEIQKQTKEDEQFVLQQINLQKQEVISKIEQHCKQVDAVMQTLKEKEKDIQDNLANEPLSLIQVTLARWISETQNWIYQLEKEQNNQIMAYCIECSRHSFNINITFFDPNFFCLFPDCQSLTFDLNTVHTNLTVSQDRKTVTWSESKQSYSPHPERFTYDSQVLCSECFNTGISTWDIKISGEYFKVGVAYQKLERKKLLTSILGQNSASWCICSLKGEFKAWHNNICTYFTPTKDLKHIRVCLDYEGGTLSFYQVTNTLLHLHTFKTTFSEPVYPAFKCGDDTTMTLC